MVENAGCLKRIELVESDAGGPRPPYSTTPMPLPRPPHRSGGPTFPIYPRFIRTTTTTTPASAPGRGRGKRAVTSTRR